MKRITSLLVCLMLFSFTAMFAQDIQIKGTVTDDNGEPLPGVSVVVKGTKIGMATDVNGEYSLSVPPDATIVFSAVGMKSQEIAVAGQSNISPVLSADVLGLDEVVVTALGIPREKKSLGYAVQTVTSDEVSRTNNPNLQTALSGKMAGVEIRQSSGMPGSPATVLIRGARSFDGNNEPLYVVDGMPIASGPDYGQNVTGAYNSARTLDLNPNDIESINILKGQAAAALYGLRASNGVIVITTKSGKNITKGKARVDITSSYTIDKIARYPDVQQTYAQGYYEDFYPAFSYSWGPAITDLPDIPTYGGNSQGHPGQWFDPYKGQWVNPQAFNNAKGFFETGGTWYNGINISNANNFASYAVGLSATDQTGIVPNTGMQRYTAKMNSEINLGSKWKAGFSGNYSDVDLQKLPSGNSSMLFTVMGCPASFDLMGTPYHMDGPLGEYRQISYRRGAVGDNPRWATTYNHFYEQTRRFFGNTYLEFKPLDWVNMRYQFGIDSYATDHEDYYEAGTSQTGQALPTAGNYPTPNNPVYGYREPTGGSIDNYGLNHSTWNSLLNITMTKKLTDDIGATLIVGNEINDITERTWTMSGTGLVLPGWDNMSNTTTQTADESKYRSRTVGTFANLELDYKSMIFLTSTGRYDVVSTMPRGNRSFFYPSVSLGFVFTELGALKDNNLLPYGKFRASFAQVGQAGTYHERTYVLGDAESGFLDDGIQYPFGGVSGFRPSSTIYDPNLVPQNTVNYEFGIELKFLNNRLGLDYAYSDQTSTDQIFSVPMAGSTGYSSFVTNAGKMTSKFHEITLYATPVKSSNFEWDLQANITIPKNEVISLAEGIESVFLAGYETPNVRAYAGNTYPTIYGLRMARDENGNILIDDDPNSYYYGYPIPGEDGVIGNVSPDYLVNLTNTFKFMKMFALTAQFDWKQGGDVYSGSNRLMGLYGSAGFTEDRVTTFQYKDTENSKGVGVKASDGSVNDITRGGPDDIWAYPDFYSDIYGSIDEMAVYETSYIKLREIALTISLPSKLVAPIKMQSASVSLVGRNFLLWSTLPNVDPETSQGMGNGQGGFEYVSLPQTASYGITLNLTF